MENPKRPLVEALIKFNEADPVSFHVPGHKGESCRVCRPNYARCFVMILQS